MTEMHQDDEGQSLAGQGTHPVSGGLTQSVEQGGLWRQVVLRECEATKTLVTLSCAGGRAWVWTWKDTI